MDLRQGLARLALAVPPLPGTLLAVTRLLDEPESVDVDRVANLVRHDPLVVARLLKVSNSAHYGLQRTVDSADRAVDLLGPVTTIGIVTGMGMLRLRSALEGPAAASFMRLVRHSMATARLARTIGKAVGMGADRCETAFTAGLLHDLGKILLVYHEPGPAVGLFERSEVLADDAGDCRDLEQLAFGYDHTEAGEYVARRLDFPDVLVNAIRHHHDPVPFESGVSGSDILAVVAAADLAASALGFAFVRSHSWTDLSDHPAWNALPARLDAPVRRAVESDLEAIARAVDGLIALPPAGRTTPERPPRRRTDGPRRSGAGRPNTP